MTQETEKTPARIEDAIRAMIEARAARERTEAEIAAKRAQEKSLRDRMALLEAALQPRSITAWCADATEDAEGTVGTIEVNGEFGAQDSILVVAPQEVLPTLQAGAIVSREVQSGHQAYFNAAILPGWQKHQPTYRAGKIRTIDRAANTCTVDLDAARSSAQALDINQAMTLTGVPVRYMSCDAAAFEDDDRVIIEFQEQDWARPVVIGFVERPRPCAAIAISLRSEVRAPAGYPDEKPEDWTLKPHKTQFCEYDPATGAVKNFAVVDNEYRYDNWREGTGGNVLAGAYTADYSSTLWSEPFVYGRKTWVAAFGTSPAGFDYGGIRAHDDSIKSISGKIPRSAAGSEIYAIEYSDSPVVTVFNGETLTTERTLSVGASVQQVKARAGFAVVLTWLSSAQTQIAAIVIDAKTGEEKARKVIGTSDPDARSIVDVAVNSKHFALITQGAQDLIELYSIETGALVDVVQSYGAQGIAMNEKYLVAALMSGENGAPFGTPGGGVDVYRVRPEGLSFVRTDYPFAALGDAGYPYAG